MLVALSKMCLTYKNKSLVSTRLFLVILKSRFYISDLTFSLIYDILLLQKVKEEK